MRYVRLSETLNSKGELVPLALVVNEEKLFSRILKNKEADWYKSLFHYGEDAKDYFINSESIAGFTGEALSEQLVFDFDDVENLDRAKADSIELLNRLIKLGINVGKHSRVYFSGNKGFHIEIPINRSLNPEEMKTVCSSLCKGLKTFDSVIYNTTRLYRIANTKHNKSGLYKIELEPEELLKLSAEKIREKARKFYKSTFIPETVQNVDFIDNILKASNKPVPNTAKTTQAKTTDNEDFEEFFKKIKGLDSINFSLCPPHTPRCIYALSQGIMVPGERSRVFFRLAAFYRNQGMNKEVAHNTLKGIARLNSNLYPESQPITKEELWSQHVASAYSSVARINPGGFGSSEDNELVEKYCRAVDRYTSKKCVLHAKQDKVKPAVQIDEVSDSFKNFAENFDKNTVKTGIDFIDSNMNIAIGTTTLLVGACGSGKSSLSFNIMERANKLGQYTVFFSLDMPKTLVFLKLALKVTNYTQDQIFQFYKEGNRERIEELKNKVAKAYDKTFFDFNSTLTMEEMRDKVFAIEERYGVDIKLVMIDYASRISGKFSDRYANATYNALKSVQVADETAAAWVFITQISRNIGDGSNPLRTKRAAKESGDWEESATNVITMWRPFMAMDGQNVEVRKEDGTISQYPIQDNIIRLFLAKNRMGKEVEMPLKWNGAKGEVLDMTDEEYELYKEEGWPDAEREIIRNKYKR